MLSSACSGQSADTSTTGTSEPQPTTITTTTSLPPDPAVDGPVFRIGLTSPITTGNWWAAMDTGGTPVNRAVHANTKAALFELTRPGFAHAPALAATVEPTPAREQGSVWVVEQPIRDDVSWTDGEPVTADDLVFYFDVVRELGLGGSHASNFPAAVTDMSAVGDYTVRVEFSSSPALTDWQTGVAMAPLVPSHFWGGPVEEAREVAASRGAEAGRRHLYSVEASGEPSSGSLVLESRDEDVVVARSNPGYFARGTETTVYSDGSVRRASPTLDEVFGGEAAGEVLAHHVVGPFVSLVEWRAYEGEGPAYEALAAGEVDFVADQEGMSLTRYNELASDDLGLSISPADGFRALGFNLRKAPMSDPVFRQAVATLIDRDLVASTLLNGTLFPAHTLIHPDLGMFRATDVSRPGWSAGRPMGQDQRFETAIELLTDAGYTWDTEPELVYGQGGELVDVVPGAGLEMPNGVDVPDLTLVAAPGSGDDPVRATYALWIGRWVADLGVPVGTELMDLDSIVGMVIEPETSEDILSWDMHVLGWGGPDPALPGLTLVALFHSSNRVESGGLNTTGYASSEFDQAAEAFLAADTIAEAAELTREMERIISADLPYLSLYRPAVIEAFGSRVTFPVDAIMGGHGVAPGSWSASLRIDR